MEETELLVVEVVRAERVGIPIFITNKWPLPLNVEHDGARDDGADDHDGERHLPEPILVARGSGVQPLVSEQDVRAGVRDGQRDAGEEHEDGDEAVLADDVERVFILAEARDHSEERDDDGVAAALDLK